MSWDGRKTRANSSLLILVVAAAAVACAYALLPDDRTRAAAALRDGHFTEALQLFERTVETHRDPNVLVRLYRLYVHFGQRDKAGAALRRFVDQNPTEVWALKELVTHYKQSHEETLYLRALRELIHKAPSRQSFAELMGHYRLNGDVKDEIALFWEGQKLGLVDNQDVVRAGLILASQGELATAAELLRSVDLSQNPRRESIQVNLFHILVDLSRFDDALSLALKIHGTADNWRRLASAFEQAGQADHADRLRSAALSRRDAKPF